MSRKLELAYYEMAKSKFTLHTNNTLEVINASIFWSNFSGKPDNFGNTTRNFKLCVPEELAAELEKMGWKVHVYDLEGVRDKDDNPVKLYAVRVIVSMEGAFPPQVYLISTFNGKKTRRPLDAESICELDSVDFKSTSKDPKTGEGEDSTGVDLLIDCYESRRFKGKVIGYLKKMYATQDEQVEFGGKYDEWEDEADMPMPMAGFPSEGELVAHPQSDLTEPFNPDDK